jgi:hypothetical protein
MIRKGRLPRAATLVFLAVGVTLPLDAAPEQVGAPRPVPKLEPVAETRLLMEGLAQANFRGLERSLKDRPADAEAWSFARGQALLIAETGNLLMLRPPKGAGQDVWMQRATELRERAVVLARQAGTRDYERSKSALVDLAGACNRCHGTFRVPVRIGPGAGDRSVE